MKVLLARLYEKQQSELMGARAEMRKNQVGSGDRSDKVRTYNFPQNRVTDHRVNVTLYKLDQFMEGNIDEIIEALKLSAREAQLLEQNL
jgi:peptide chain release factor 1